MTTNHRIGAALCRGFITASVIATALAVRAQTDLDKTKQESAATYKASRSGDATTCLQEAAKMNNATIKFGQLASQKAQNAELKRFGQTLEADHKKAQTKLEAIAKSHNVTLPTSLDAKCEAEMSKLRDLTGTEFDQEFAKGAVEGHAMAVAHLQQASTEAKDADIAQYSRDMLAHMKEHQMQARQVARTVGVDQATIASLEAKAKEGVGAAGATTETSRGSDAAKDIDSTKPDRPSKPE